MPSATQRIRELREGVEGDALLVYERVAPGTATSVGRIRRELAEVLAGLKVATDRLDDIALVVTEAATNVVLHAYARGTTGPLYAAATLSGHTLTVTVADHGRGLSPHGGSEGLGFGLPLMVQLTDGLNVTSNPCGTGTRIAFSFRQAIPTPRRSPAGRAPPSVGTAELLCDYARALIAASTALHAEACALLAETRQTLAHSRRRARGRAEGT